MTIYNVRVKFDMVMAVEADSENEAENIGREDWERAARDADRRPVVVVTGEVTELEHLRDGWDGMCIPYGGDGNTRLSELLTPNVQLERPAAEGG